MTDHAERYKGMVVCSVSYDQVVAEARWELFKAISDAIYEQRPVDDEQPNPVKAALDHYLELRDNQ